VFMPWRALVLTLGIFAILAVAAPSQGQIGVGVVVSLTPPELPVYDQPVCPGDDYIWTPGYWDWDADEGDYFWVPGTWVQAPEPGYLWTPGYWAWRDTGYVWTAGYWGPVVGFYGGINYGFGYFGHGFEGGRWDRGHFFYNRSVANVNVNIIHNTYEQRVDERAVTRVSFNGGRGGVEARATAQEEAASRGRHVGPVAAQTQHVQEARGNRELRASVNHGAPAIAATAKPTDFRTGVVRTRQAGRVNNPPAGARPGGNDVRNNEARPSNEPRPNNEARPGNVARPSNEPQPGNAARPNPAGHARDIQPGEKLPPPHTGNSKTDQKYQKQQEQLATKQEQQRQKLQQQQEKEHQKAQKQQGNEARQQQMEQRHRQQTQQLQQRQQQERQHMQQRQAPKPAPKPAPGKPH